MKKLLLPLAAALVAAPAFAIVENSTYADADGLTCKNLYNISRAYDAEAFGASPLAEFNNKTRSMVAKDGKLYVAHSRTVTVGEGDAASSNDYAHVIVYDQVTGKFLEQVQLTVAGTPLAGLLCANQIGVDDFGNFWLMGLCGNTATTPWRLYHIKDITTGDTELVAELTLPEDEAEAAGRHDYYDLVGDVTGTQAGTVVMSPVANGSACFVVGYERAQGSNEWGPHMSGGEYYSNPVAETYPADQTTWNGAPQIRIIRDDEHSGNLYYIDAFVTYPALYDVEGAMLDSFLGCEASATEGAQANANGMNEFSIAGNDYLAYALTDYDKGVGSQIRVCKLGEGQSIEAMTKSWDLPANGLGTLTDTGSRMFGIVPRVVTDANGKEGCYLSLYKCNGGLATYLIAEPGFEDAGATDIIADTDANAPAQYFDLQGRRLTNPAAGTLVIERRGTTATKRLVK